MNAAETEPLGRRMTKGAAWMVAVRLLDRLVGLISTIVLARLLVPSDFGVVALATTVIAILDIWAEFGFDLALIRDQKAARRHYDTAWTLMVIRGLIVALLIALSASHVADFFQEPKLESVLYVLALMPLIEGFQSIRVVDFRKDLLMHKEFAFFMSARMTQFFLTIALAFLWESYWALIAGILANRSTKLVLSYLMAPYRPQFTLSAFSDLFGFSKWVVVNSLLNFMNTRLDTFVVGRVSGTSALGTYSMAYEVSNMATTELVWPISRALFPGFSKLQDNREELVKSYNLSLSIIVLLALPVTVGIGLTAEYAVPLLLGEKWLAAIPIIQVLVIYGGMRVLIANSGALYMAIGKPYLVSLMAASSLAVMAPMMIWLVHEMGPIGAAWAVVSGTIPMIVLMFVFNLRYIAASPLQTLSFNLRPVVGVILMATTLLTVKNYMVVSTVLYLLALQLLLLAVIGAAVYIAVVLMLARLSKAEQTSEALVLGAVRGKLISVLGRGRRKKASAQ